MTLESISPESLLNNLPVRIQTALLLDPEDSAHLSELPLVEDDVLLRVDPRHCYSLLILARLH